jgi:hypothetical protein
MQIFSIKNITPITNIAFILGAITISHIAQQKSMIGTAYAEDKALLSEDKHGAEKKPSILPSMDDSFDFVLMEDDELPDEMAFPNPEEPVKLPTGYGEEPNPQMGTFPSGMQIIHASFENSPSEQTAQEGPGPVEPPDPTNPHSERTGKGGGFKGQMGSELPPVITMGEQPEDGGLTSVIRGYQPE